MVVEKESGGIVCSEQLNNLLLMHGWVLPSLMVGEGFFFPVKPVINIRVLNQQLNDLI
jgi:hypothetical protein